MYMSLALAMGSDFAASSGNGVVVGKQGSTAAIAAERFAWEEAVAADGAEIVALRSRTAALANRASASGKARIS